MPDGNNQIRYFIRGAWKAQYREGGNPKGGTEDKNAVPGIRSGDYDRIQDSSLPTNPRNRAGD